MHIYVTYLFYFLKFFPQFSAHEYVPWPTEGEQYDVADVSGCANGET